MKNVIIFLMLTAFSIYYAQEIKVKRGEIQIDGRPVAKIDKEKNIYTISDLSGKTLFTATITDRTPLRNLASKNWLQLTGANGVVRELDLIPKTSFSFGLEKPITENLILSSDPLLSASGVDESKINKFFQNEDRSISKAEDMVIEKDNSINRSEDSIAKVNKLVLDKVGIISANNQKIGYLVRKVTGKDMLGDNLSYIVLDLNKISVAQIDFSSYSKTNVINGLVLKTFDGKKFSVRRANYTSDDFTYDELAPRIIRKLYANGYTLGDMKSMVEISRQENLDAYNQKNKEMMDQAKADSKNIYDTPGYIIDKSGNKKEGNITMEFESLSSKSGGEKNVYSLSGYGTAVNLTANGKTETYKAKDGVKFCVGGRCFIGVSGSEDGGTGNNSGSQFSVLGESLFFEILAEDNGNYVLNYFKSPQYYYLKIANQPKAIYLGDKAGFGYKKAEKIKKIFDEYVKCPTLDFSKYDTKTKEGLIMVLNDYQASCKK